MFDFLDFCMNYLLENIYEFKKLDAGRTWIRLTQDRRRWHNKKNTYTQQNDNESCCIKCDYDFYKHTAPGLGRSRAPY